MEARWRRAARACAASAASRMSLSACTHRSHAFPLADPDFSLLVFNLPTSLQRMTSPTNEAQPPAKPQTMQSRQIRAGLHFERQETNVIFVGHMRANAGIPAGKNTPRSAGRLKRSKRWGNAMGLAVGAGAGGSRAFCFRFSAGRWGREGD